MHVYVLLNMETYGMHMGWNERWQYICIAKSGGIDRDISHGYCKIKGVAYAYSLYQLRAQQHR